MSAQRKYSGRRAPISVAGLVQSGLAERDAQLWVGLRSLQGFDISAETVAQLEVALRAGNREELLRLLRVAHVDAAAAEQALALIAAGGPVGDVAGAAQRLKEVRTAIAYALTHRADPAHVVAKADAVRPKAQEAERKLLERRDRNRAAGARMRDRRRNERATLIVQVAALGDACADLQQRCDASEAKLHELREATSDESVLRDFALVDADDQRAFAAAFRARNADLARDVQAAATNALAGEANAWALVQAPRGLSGDCAAARAAFGWSQAVATAVRREAVDFDSATASLDRGLPLQRATPATPATPKKRKAAASASATPATSATPKRRKASKAIEMRRVGDASWRIFGSQKDASKAFGISQAEVSYLVNDRSKAIGYNSLQFEARRVTQI